jgi:hypothetical protein
VVTAKDSRYHPECYIDHVAPTCAYCGQKIIGDRIEDFWGSIYHAEHLGQAVQCEYCRRFISDRQTNGGVKYSDGRVICGLCYATAVYDLEQAQRLMEQVCSLLATCGIAVDAEQISLQLVDRPTLISESPDDSGDQTGLTVCRRRDLSDRIRLLDIRILVLSGLPKKEFVATIAHELMHAWLYRSDAVDRNPAWREGSCNYAGFLALQSDSSIEARYVLKRLVEDDNETYGIGYERVSDFVRDHGVESWLRYLQSREDFPPGY